VEGRRGEQRECSMRWSADFFWGERVREGRRAEGTQHEVECRLLSGLRDRGRGGGQREYSMRWSDDLFLGLGVWGGEESLGSAAVPWVRVCVHRRLENRVSKGN
jgi:archaeosine-15-forming tRNA-guanine transglycosylase